MGFSASTPVAAFTVCLYNSFNIRTQPASTLWVERNDIAKNFHTPKLLQDGMTEPNSM